MLACLRYKVTPRLRLVQSLELANERMAQTRIHTVIVLIRGRKVSVPGLSLLVPLVLGATGQGQARTIAHQVVATNSRLQREWQVGNPNSSPSSKTITRLMTYTPTTECLCSGHTNPGREMNLSLKEVICSRSLVYGMMDGRRVYESTIVPRTMMASTKYNGTAACRTALLRDQNHHLRQARSRHSRWCVSACQRLGKRLWKAIPRQKVVAREALQYLDL